MFAKVMLILQLLRCRLDSGVDGLGTVCHFGHFFQYYGIVDSLFGILAPGKRSMILAQHSGNCLGILAQTLELIDDQMSGIFLVSILDLFLRQAAHAGNRSVDLPGWFRSRECLFPPVPNW